MFRRRPLSLALLALVCPLLLAMGGGGSGPASDTIPRPEQNHSAEVVDRQGVVTELSHVSCGGKTFFPLERGEGTLMVPFAKVVRADFGDEAGARVEARVTVEGGRTLEGSLSRTLLCTGATEYGNYQVEIRGLKSVSFTRP